MTLFLVLLSLTLVLEAPFFLLGLRDHPWKTRITFWLGANLLSYPAVFFVFPHLDWPFWAQEAGAELWAPACEIFVGWFIVPRFSRRDASIVVFANLFSWLVGRALWMVPAVQVWVMAF
jgi:hypothetical protein